MLGNSGFPTINDIIDVGSFAGRAVFFYGLLHRKHSLNTYVVASGYTSAWIDQTRTSNRLGTTGIRLRPFFFFYVPKCGPRLSLRHSLWFEISWKYPTEEHTSLKKKNTVLSLNRLARNFSEFSTPSDWPTNVVRALENQETICFNIYLLDCGPDPKPTCSHVPALAWALQPPTLTLGTHEWI